MRRKLGTVVVALAVVGATPAFPVESIQTSEPVVLQADELRYDEELGVLVAVGHVEIAQGERILLADTVTYNQKTDTVTASGNVVLLEPSGEVLFADYVELTDELTRGIVRGLKMRLTDNSRLAAAGGQRRGAITEMRKVVYSPCELCPNDPERPPLWQLKAQRIIHDQRARDIIYNDVFLEVFGVPVAYTPYFRHPDPTVKRRSGFLAPTLGSSSLLGATLQIPYYFNIAPHIDATFAPIFTTKEGVVLVGEYRQHTGNGQFLWNGSITHVDRRGDFGERVGGQETRGHIEGRGLFDVDETWRWGFDVARSSDDTYLRRYRFSAADTLTSRLFVESLRGRTYASGNAYLFQ
ncbi:MAG: LPS-assembly protein LptD, partial [Alphaproteobacteria bacterium]